jgi:hypothetical protein
MKSLKKHLRVLLTTVAMIVVAGTMAGAATGGVPGKPTPSPPVTVSESPTPEPAETEAPEPIETEATEAEATSSDEAGTAPDFSACDGLTGLENAICRHEALLKVRPDNPGLTNSLARLRANAEAHAARQAAKAAGAPGNSEHGNSGSHGPSGS